MQLRILLLGLLLIPAVAWGLTKDDLRDNPPAVYTVKKGDTLWDIAGKFLEDPWKWPELWDRNPYISNPDLIYPGDRLRLRMVDGEPRVTRQRVERLSPKVEEKPVERLEPISTVDRSIVLPYIDRYGLLPPGKSPRKLGGYLVAGAKERVMYSNGDRVFVRLDGIRDPETRTWYTFQKPEPIRAPGSEKLLGYLLTHTGRLRLKGRTDEGLHAARVERTYAPIEKGDRVYRGEGAADRPRFLPKPAPSAQGRILRHIGDETLLGQGQMVLFDLGSRDGLERGHVLIVRGHQRRVQEPGTDGETVRLPGREKGAVMVIQAGKRMSFGLIMRNRLPVEAGDRLVSPES